MIFELFNKHYIGLDENDSIVKTFSDALEAPTETDICINEQGGRQFELNGEFNPPIRNIKGQPIYKWDGSKAIKWTEAELDSLYPVPAAEPDRLTVLEQSSAVTAATLDSVLTEFIPALMAQLMTP
jgi:hypothetical protein